MSYIELKNAINIKIPVIEAQLMVCSDDSNNFNKYSQFILKLLYEKRTVEYISEITKFKKEQIENEIEFLIKYGMLNEKQDSDIYSLTDVGIKIVTQIDEIDSFNRRNIKVLIDKYTGAVIKYRNDLVKVDGGIYKIVKDTYKNLNPVNSKRFLLQNYNEYFSDSTIEDLDVELNLYSEFWVEIKLYKLRELVDYRNSIGYFKLPELNFILEGNSEELLEQDEEDGIKSLVIKGIVYKFKLKVCDENLNIYRNYIDKIIDLNKLDENLITENAKNIMNRFYLEESINKELNRPIYLDSVSGIITMKDPEIKGTVRGNICTIEPIVKIEKLSEAHLKSIIKTSFNNVIEAVDNNFTVKYELIDEIEVIKKIPTSLIY